MTNDELVAVMVPKTHLAKVYAYVGQLSAPLSETSMTVAEPRPAEGTYDDWTASRLERMVRESQAAMTDILRTLAEHADEWITTHDLAAAIRSKPDADWNTVAGTIGAYGRRLKNRYGIKTKPYDERRNHDAGCKEFRMPKAIAHVVIQILEKKATGHQQ